MQNEMAELLDNQNFTQRWLDYILWQIFEKHKTHSINRNQIIEIDYNLSSTNKAGFPEYLLRIVKKEIKSSFSLVSTEFLVLFSIIFGFIFICGLLSNFMIVLSFYRSKNLRTFQNIFIVNLAISDILLCSICGPLTLFRYIDLNWKFGRILCKLGPGLQTANVLVSTLSITAIAVDRWNIIVNSGKSAKKYSLYFSIFMIWTISLLISIPSFIVNDLKTIQIKQTKEVLYKLCEETWLNQNSKFIFCIILIIFQYILPVIIVGSTHYKICSFLHLNVPKIFRKKNKKHGNTDTEMKEHNQGDHTHHNLLNSRTSYFVEKILHNNERFSRSKKILLIVFLTFSFCWLPVALCNLLLDFTLLFDFSDAYYINGSKLAIIILLVNVAALSSTSLNPIIYGLMNKNFKQEIRKMFMPNTVQNEQKNLQQQQAKTELMKDTSISVFNNNNNNNKSPRCANSNNTFV